MCYFSIIKLLYKVLGVVLGISATFQTVGQMLHRTAAQPTIKALS